MVFIYKLFIFAPYSTIFYARNHARKYAQKHAQKRCKVSYYNSNRKKIMVKIKEYETDFMRRRRERNEKICKAYLNRSSDILKDGIKPQRVMERLAKIYKTSAYNVKRILLENGVFIDKNTPVVFPEGYVSPAEQAASAVMG